MTAAALIPVLAMAFGGEIVDRIVVTVNRGIVTESDIRRHILAAAALNDEHPDFGEQARREAVGRLIDLALIRREMELSRFPEPTPAETKAWAALVYQDRLPRFTASVTARPGGLSEKDLIEELRNQLITLRFIESRFRPGISVTDAEIQSYYEKQILPQHKAGDGDPPALDDVRVRIEKILADQRIDEALHRWLEDARKQARIVFASGAGAPAPAKPQGKTP